MPALAITELTDGENSVTGVGVFDVLMKAARAHLDDQFTQGRIRGPEYSTVYLGSLELAMQTALAFVLQQRKNDLEAQLVEQQVANAVLEGTVLVAQECKLRAEFDLTVSATEKSAQEILLLAQKIATEKAQILSTGVDANSVIGKQKLLYEAQTNGFARDAEQKAAKLLVDSWSVRRTTDEGTVADATNMLYDTAVGRAVTKVLEGVGA
jgi:hypothetical protein